MNKKYFNLLIIIIIICVLFITCCTLFTICDNNENKYQSATSEKYKLIYVERTSIDNIEQSINNYYELGYTVIAMNNRFVLLEKMYYVEEILE